MSLDPTTPPAQAPGAADEKQRDEKPADDKQLLAQVYDQLRAIARARIARERAGHSLQATELVHEAFLKLQKHPSLMHADRARFFHAAAEAMRQILIDHARSKGRIKRGGGMKRTMADVADVAELAEEPDADQILALDEAIRRLETEEPQAAQVLKLRFFTGLSVAETAELMGLSQRTVKREWQYARAWMFREIGDDEHAAKSDGPAPPT